MFLVHTCFIQVDLSADKKKNNYYVWFCGLNERPFGVNWLIQDDKIRIILSPEYTKTHTHNTTNPTSIYKKNINFTPKILLILYICRLTNSQAHKHDAVPQ